MTRASYSLSSWQNITGSAKILGSVKRVFGAPGTSGLGRSSSQLIRDLAFAIHFHLWSGFVIDSVQLQKGVRICTMEATTI